MISIAELQSKKTDLRQTDTVVKTLGDMFPEKRWKGRVVKKDGNSSVLEATHAATHGTLGKKEWKAPRQTVYCEDDARPGYDTMPAHEYDEDEEVMVEKVRLLASLLRQSKATCAYTGAGISTASGIDDYATKVHQENRKKVASPFDALPTRAHKIMAKMHKCKHLHYWIQQNHDGLPQKAGYPQHALNEIHGAWYDPSYPVVKMDGSLREDLFADLLSWETKSDLVLALGTSMCGMNADRLARTCSNKAGKGQALGTVIINLQRTQMDEVAQLRIFATLDKVFGLLAKELNYDSEDVIGGKDYYVPDVHNFGGDVFTVPYDVKGNLDTNFSTLDLRHGAKLKITAGPHEGSIGEVTSKCPDGRYKITFTVQVGKGKFSTPWPMTLGSWWVEAAVKGQVARIPVVTVEPAPPQTSQTGNHDDDYKALYAPQALESAGESLIRDYNGRVVTLSGMSMTDGAPPPKDLLAEVKARAGKPKS